jgi:putative membrane protein
MLTRALTHIIAVTLVLLALPQFVSGIEVADPKTALVVAIVWGFITLIIRPVLSLLTLPITLLTFGLFSLFLNAFLFWCLNFIDGFAVHGFIPALIGSVTLSVVSYVLHALFSRE